MVTESTPALRSIMPAMAVSRPAVSMRYNISIAAAATAAGGIAAKTRRRGRLFQEWPAAAGQRRGGRRGLGGRLRLEVRLAAAFGWKLMLRHIPAAD